MNTWTQSLDLTLTHHSSRATVGLDTHSSTRADTRTPQARTLNVRHINSTHRLDTQHSTLATR
eukprot:2836407-Rhodomonas_salina.1